jgi:hypothetical protein
MLSLSGKKKSGPKIIDRVFISSQAKGNAVLEKVRHQDVIVITWFEESYSQLQQIIQRNNLNTEIFMAREIAAPHIQYKAVLFFEHYPLASKESELLEKLQMQEAVFYSALDEPLFKHFGGDKIIALMERMGLSENEAIEHPMITNAIKNAQEKISGEITFEHSASSPNEWFSKNMVK